MSLKTKELLEEEFVTGIQTLKTMNKEDKGYSAQAEFVKTTGQMILEYDKSDLDINEKREARKNMEKAEQEVRDNEKRNKFIEQCIRVGLGLIEIGAPLIFYAAWMKRGLKFEESGTFTSQTFRGLMSKFKVSRK